MAGLTASGLRSRALSTAGLLALLLGMLGCSGSSGSSSGAGGANAEGGDSNTGSGATAPSSGCKGTPIASWQAGDKSFESEMGIFSTTSDLWGFTLINCSFPSAVVSFSKLAAPVAPGMNTLDLLIVGGAPMPGHAGASYTYDDKDNYYVNATHSGTLTVTEVNNDTLTWSGEFSFTGVMEDGTTTIEIADGQVTNAKFKLPP